MVKFYWYFVFIVLFFFYTHSKAQKTWKFFSFFTYFEICYCRIFIKYLTNKTFKFFLNKNTIFLLFYFNFDFTICILLFVFSLFLFVLVFLCIMLFFAFFFLFVFFSRGSFVFQLLLRLKILLPWLLIVIFCYFLSNYLINLAIKAKYR